MIKEINRQSDSVLFEGMTSINAVIKGKNRKILTVYIDRDKKKSKQREIGFLKAASARSGFDIIEVSSVELDSMTIGNSHGGIVAECSQRVIPCLDENSDIKDNGFFVMIEGIEDPYNFGYALRTIYASGADGIILSKRNWMSAAGVVCRSSAGASELIPIFEAEPEDAADYFKEKGYKIACAGIRNSVSLYDADLSFPVLLIVGGEKRGISSSLLKKADVTVRIEYGREFKGSLSAASASSVLTYEVFRQNRNKLM